MPGDVNELERFILAHPVQAWFRAGAIAAFLLELAVAFHLAFMWFARLVVR